MSGLGATLEPGLGGGKGAAEGGGCADGQTVRRAGLYSQKGVRGSRIKAPTDSDPALCLGTPLSYRTHYAVPAINAGTGIAGV